MNDLLKTTTEMKSKDLREALIGRTIIEVLTINPKYSFHLVLSDDSVLLVNAQINSIGIPELSVILTKN